MSAPGSNEGPDAFIQHQAADDAEENYIGERNHQINLSKGFHQAEDIDTDKRPQYPANQQHGAHLEINGPTPPVRDDARYGRGNSLVSLRGDRNRGRDTGKDKKWRHQEATANPEHAGKKSDRCPHTQNKKNIHGQLGNGKVDLEHSRLHHGHCRRHAERDERYDR